MTSGRDVFFMVILGGVFAWALVSLAVAIVLHSIQVWETIASFCVAGGTGGLSIFLGIRYSLSHLGCFDSEKMGKGKVIVNDAQVICTDGVVLPAFVYRTSNPQVDLDATVKKPGLMFIHGFAGTPEDGECYTKP